MENEKKLWRHMLTEKMEGNSTTALGNYEEIDVIGVFFMEAHKYAGHHIIRKLNEDGPLKDTSIDKSEIIKAFWAQYPQDKKAKVLELVSEDVAACLIYYSASLAVTIAQHTFNQGPAIRILSSLDGFLKRPLADPDHPNHNEG